MLADFIIALLISLDVILLVRLFEDQRECGWRFISLT